MMANQQTQGNPSEPPKKQSKSLLTMDIKSIQFSNLVPQKQAVDKTSMNLYIKPKDGNSLSVVLPTMIIVFVIVALFAKFAVIDRLVALSKLQDEETAINSQLSILQTEMTDYEQVRSDYRRYSGKYLDDEARGYVDRIEIIELLDRVVGNLGMVSSIDIKGNTVSVKLTASSLSDIAVMRANLEAEEIVGKISVKTADRASQTYTPLSVSSSFVFTVNIPVEEGA